MMSYDNDAMPFFVIRYQGCSEDTFLVQGTNVIDALNSFMEIWDVGPEHLKDIHIQQITVMITNKKMVEAVKALYCDKGKTCES